jgi:CRISPR-associated protein Cmr5
MELRGNEMADMRSLDQERAEFAWGCVQGVGKDYTNLAKGAPAMIMGNGLMQALAFYESKSGHAGRLREHVADWLAKRKLVEGKDFQSLMKSLHGMEASGYMQATQEALEVLRWIRQFADALQQGGGP